jgi:DNA-binding MarR family transcriptional regulator
MSKLPDSLKKEISNNYRTESLCYLGTVMGRVFGRLLNAAWRDEVGYSQADLDGVSVYQIYMLNEISKYPRGNLTEMSDNIIMDRSTFIRNARPLQKRGLITMRPGRDARMKMVEVSNKGKGFLKKHLNILMKVEERLVESLEPHTGIRVNNLLREMEMIVVVANMKFKNLK